MPDERDGFIVRTFTGEEVHFIPCSRDVQRDTVLAGILRNTDTARYYVADTRDTGAVKT